MRIKHYLKTQLPGYMIPDGTVDAGNNQTYAVDIFRADGGSIQDWALHGEGDSLKMSQLDFNNVAELEGDDYAYQQLNEVRMATSSGPWTAEWTWKDDVSLYCHFPALPNSEIYSTLTPGERLKSMKDRSKFSVFQRRKGENVRSEFVGVYEPNTGNRIVNKVEKIYASTGTDWVVVLKIQLENAIHYIHTSYWDLTPQQIPFVDGDIKINWQSRFGIVVVKEGKIINQEWVEGVMEGLRHDM